jgi:hypothetical protein
MTHKAKGEKKQPLMTPQEEKQIYKYVMMNVKRRQFLEQ